MAQRDVGNLRTRLSWEDNGAKRSLTGFRDDLRGLKSEMNAARSQGRQYSNSLKGLRQQSDILNRTYKTQQERVRELRRRYEESRRVKGEDAKQTQNLSRQYNNAVAQMNRTEGQLKDVTRAIEDQVNPWKRLGRNMDTAGQRMQSFGRGMSSVGRTMTMRVTTPILGLAGAAIKVASDFEEGMSKVQAVSGATAEEMEKLEEQAKEMGETTRFSATEAASGQEFLARAGFEANQIISAMPGLLDLAASSNMDLGRAADIASNIISGFGYEANEAGRVADVLAKASASANTNVEQLGGAMQFVAPVAATLGLEMEGLTAAVGFMSDAGIQGEKAGRQLRQGMLRLASPTGKAAGIIEELGINVFDAEGNMKSMPEVIAELNKGLGDMESDARAAALATIFGTESTAGWSTLLDRGADELADYAKELENAEGAASDMADTMEDNAKGSMREFRSALESAGIAASEHLLPAFTSMVEKGTELLRKFGDLDESTQKNIIKMAGLAAAIGPAALVAGSLTTAIGGITRAGGTLLGMLGGKGGRGLIGRIGLLSLGGPVGLAIGGVTALGFAFYNAAKDEEELEEATLDNIVATRKQYEANEDLIDKFDELRDKSKLTNDEFGRYLDIQTELKRASDPQVIADLKDEAKDLAKESGLSNDELEEMIGYNNKLTEKIPEATDEITEQGNRVAGTSNELRKYNDELREMTNREIMKDFHKRLQEVEEIEKERARLQRELNESKQYEREIQAVLNNYSKDTVETKKEELKIDIENLEEQRRQLVLHGESTAEIDKQLAKKRSFLNILDGEKEDLREVLIKYMDNTDELQDQITKQDSKLQKLEAIRRKLVEEELVHAGIDQSVAKQNAKHGKSISFIDKKINKLKNERNEIIKNAGGVDNLNKKQQRTVNKIDDQIGKYKNARERVKDINDEARILNRTYGKDINKTVNINADPSIREFNRLISTPETKYVSLIGEMDRIQITGGLGGYASGTDHHPGGPFIAGEEGFELGRMGNRWELLKFGMYDRPAGYEVFTHDESRKIIQALNNLPAYADGVRRFGEADRVVRQLNDQQQRLPLTGEAVIYTTVINQIDGREFSRHTYRHITELQQLEERIAARARGEG